MNSQFRNSNFGFILYTAIVTIMVLATAFVIWFMTVGYRVGTFGPDTRLGSVYIGGLTEEEVIPLMDERITYWYNDETVVFQLEYQGYVYEFDRDQLLFNLELSTFDLKDGQTNELLAYYQPADLQEIRAEINALPFMQNIKDNFDMNGLIDALLDDAALMKSYSSKNVEDYLLDVELNIEELHSSNFRVPEGVILDDLIADLLERYPDGRVPISSTSLFDISDLLGDILNDQELTMLSSAMLENILYTNFIINEVHYQPNIDFTTYTISDYPYFGRNTIINHIVNQGFNFYNPNQFSYYFTVEKTDNFNGQVKLFGVPFENDIIVQIHTTEIPFITQSTSDVDLLQIGYNGVVVEVQRTIIDVYGDELANDVILFEFYPPITQIIFKP